MALNQFQHPGNKSLSITLLGRPNVGKSSLVNCLMGQDLSIVSHRPQTTRNRFLSVMRIDRTEIILNDTPGLHEGNKELNTRMNHQAMMTEGSDLLWLVIDGDYPVREGVVYYLAMLKKSVHREQDFIDLMKRPWWVVVTKRDKCEEISSVEAQLKELKADYPFLQESFFLSTKNEDGIHRLVERMLELAPSSAHFFDEEDISNKNERFFAAEFVREKAFELLSEELPYELAVTIDDFRDHWRDSDGPPYEKVLAASEINATILVNRPSQRAIVIGKKGAMIKQIGVGAREKLQGFLGRTVHLNLHVKCSPKWFRNNFILEEIGLGRAPRSGRVWRQS